MTAPIFILIIGGTLAIILFGLFIMILSSSTDLPDSPHREMDDHIEYERTLWDRQFDDCMKDRGMVGRRGV